MGTFARRSFGPRRSGLESQSSRRQYATGKQHAHVRIDADKWNIARCNSRRFARGDAEIDTRKAPATKCFVARQNQEKVVHPGARTRQDMLVSDSYANRPKCTVEGCKNIAGKSYGKPHPRSLCKTHAYPKSCGRKGRKPKDPSVDRKRLKRSRNLKALYGIDHDTFDVISATQNGRCAICHEEKKLHVDHCHNTGKVRGLLCHTCNAGIGMLRESPDLLHAAVRYLTKVA
jgi:hypothetical protein